MNECERKEFSGQGGTVETVTLVGIQGGRVGTSTSRDVWTDVLRILVLDKFKEKVNYYVLNTYTYYLTRPAGKHEKVQIAPGDLLWWNAETVFWSPRFYGEKDGRTEAQRGARGIPLKMFGEAIEIYK